MAQPRRVDYDRIEPGWRAGISSPAQLAEEYKDATGEPVSRVAIIKHFGKRGIPRDLAAKIKAKADALVAAAAVTGMVSVVTKARETAIVDAGAIAVATVLLGQRSDIRRARTLCMALLGELEAQTGNQPGMAELGEMLRCPGETGADKLNDIYRAVISLPERSKTMKALTESLKSMIGLEREAYGRAIDDDTPKDAAPQMSDIDVARRIAFALHKGLIAQREQK